MIIGYEVLLEQVPQLNRPLTTLKGIGRKKAGFLAHKGIHTLFDLLLFLPVRYEDKTRIWPISEVKEGAQVLVCGKVISGREERFYRSGKRLFRIVVRDGSDSMDLIWFQYRKAYLTRFSRPDTDIMVFGRMSKDRGKGQMIHPEVFFASDEEKGSVLGIHPVYSTVQGISARVLRPVIMQALEACREYPGLKDPLPRDITRRLGLPEFLASLQYLHGPPESASIEKLNQGRTPSHQRLIFDRFFSVMLSVAYRRRARKERSGAVLSIPGNLVQRLGKCLGFSLTRDQLKAVSEIAGDLSSGKPMNRLLQGDVGCGKTVVAAVAAYLTVRADRQVAIMVPTQVLAFQHMAYFSDLSATMGFRPVLLTGGVRRSARLTVCEEIRNGKYNVIIGTQALVQEGVRFETLGLVVIDEQHRFGVRQRALLDSKGAEPHLLVMSATPIPRSLAMTVYADLDISVIREYPKGRLPVRTYLVNRSQKRAVFETVNQRMSSGQQVMVICPVIEGSEETDLKNALHMHESLKALFSGRFRVGLVHGRLSPDEKLKTMTEFREGRIDLLVGTTVVEVGVHAPAATVMVIEHPERFGLAQLHQLRGRVGRGTEQGLCFLMISEETSEKSLPRLRVLEASNDGFEISQKDLEMRGQGELMGTRQAGAGELDLREILKEPELLMKAKEEVEWILERDAELLCPENRVLKEMVKRTFEGPLVDF